MLSDTVVCFTIVSGIFFQDLLTFQREPFSCTIDFFAFFTCIIICKCLKFYSILQLCMVLIKVSDISNEARPMDVAEPWLDCLLQEFFEQSDREKMEGLPVTPFMDRDKITKPSSQCSFIGFVLLPLFEAIGRLYPELDVKPHILYYVN